MIHGRSETATGGVRCQALPRRTRSGRGRGRTCTYSRMEYAHEQKPIDSGMFAFQNAARGQCVAIGSGVERRQTTFRHAGGRIDDIRRDGVRSGGPIAMVKGAGDRRADLRPGRPTG